MVSISSKYMKFSEALFLPVEVKVPAAELLRVLICKLWKPAFEVCLKPANG
jgi:hypothetical protein